MADSPKTHGQSRNRATRSIRSTKFAQMYNHADWRRMSKAQLLAHPLCAECDKNQRVTIAHHADHIEPHEGDWSLFLNESNIQSLCRSCHSSKTRREQNRAEK